MITKFLLNLSAGRISLERSSEAGTWVNLGTIKPDDLNLTGSLAKLRTLAQPDATGPLEVMISLPMDQVKTLSLKKLDMTRADVVTAFTGQTPYDVSELCVDWVNTEEGSAIAAVARDTLNDVADFAQRSNFSAIMFVALPGGSWQNDFAIFDLSESPVNEMSLRLPPYINAPELEKPSELEYISSIAPHQKLAKITKHLETQAYSIQKPLEEQISVEVASHTLDPTVQPTNSIRTSPSADTHSGRTANLVHSGAPIITGVLKSDPNKTGQNTNKLRTSSVRQQAPLSGKRNYFMELAVRISKHQKFKTKKVIPVRKSIRKQQLQVGGKPRYLGVILTTLLLTFMLTVAAWAATDRRKPDTLLRSLVPTITALTELPKIPTVPNEDTIPDETLKLFKTTPIESKLFNITAKKRPKARPSFLEVQITRTSLSKFLSKKLVLFRPVSRQTMLKRAHDMGILPTELATATSLRPEMRPNWIEILARTPAQTVAIPSKTQAAKATSEQSVIQAATIKNILNLRNINLIGVSGTKRNPNALVRLASGKVLKVKIGDRLNGGRVTNIQTTTLTYVKSGRSIVLEMPRG